MYLKADNLVIRQALKEDAKCLCKWWSDGKVMAHAGFPKGLKTDLNRLKASLEKEENNEFYKRLMIEIDSKKVGEMMFRIESNIAEIGIKICDFTYQNKGYGTKALKLLINYLFHQRFVEKIVLNTNLSNTRAQHVYESLGFKKLGIRENSWKNQLGELQSTVDYELVKGLDSY